MTGGGALSNDRGSGSSPVAPGRSTAAGQCPRPDPMTGVVSQSIHQARRENWGNAPLPGLETRSGRCRRGRSTSSGSSTSAKRAFSFGRIFGPPTASQTRRLRRWREFFRSAEGGATVPKKTSWSTPKGCRAKHFSLPGLCSGKTSVRKGGRTKNSSRVSSPYTMPWSPRCSLTKRGGGDRARRAG